MKISHEIADPRRRAGEDQLRPDRAHAEAPGIVDHVEQPDVLQQPRDLDGIDVTPARQQALGRRLAPPRIVERDDLRSGGRGRPSDPGFSRHEGPSVDRASAVPD
jgi:hypothetical protein